MAPFDLVIQRSATSELVVQALPDGSMAIFDVATKNVYSLNASAAAAWEACESPIPLPRLAEAMSRRLNTPVTEALAREAVSELAAAGLIIAPPDERDRTSRRELLKHAAVAIPLVLVLTGAEQRAHAQVNGSGPITTPPLTTTPGTTAPGTTTTTTTTTTSPPQTTTTTTTTTPAPTTGRRFQIVKFVGQAALAGAEFDVLNDITNAPVTHMVTDGNGFASTQLIPGVRYRLVETFAPPSLASYAPFPPQVFTMQDLDGFGFNLHNTLLG